jgi:hypothetical protein
MSVTNTYNVTLAATYQNLADLVGGGSGKIPIGDGTANKVLITATTNSADIAWGDVVPTLTTGHPIAAGDSVTLNGLSEIKHAWLRNTVGASASVAIITAFEVHE